MARPLKVLVLGYYGYGNAGDELVLAGIRTGIAAAADGRPYELRALSGDPMSTSRDHGLQAYGRFSLTGLLSALSWCDVLVLGGGSLIQDATSRRSALYYIWMMRLAQALGRKVFLWAQGFGPLDDSALRQKAASALRGVAAVTLRDEQSAREVLELGIAREKVHLSADPAFLVRPRFEGPLQAASADESTLGVALRSWPGREADISRVVEACGRFGAVTGSRLLFIALQHPNDVEVSSSGASVTKSEKAPSPLPPEGLVRLISGLGMVAAVRLHALIVAAAASVPFAGISYDPKVERFCSAAGMPCLELQGLLSGELLDILLSVQEHRAEAAEKLTRFRDQQTQLAQLSAKIFWDGAGRI